jgi:hypothetical protein
VPTYFFNVRGGPIEAEADEGLSYPDEAAARAAALAGARSMIAADLLEGSPNLDCRIEVTDKNGKLLFSIPFESAFSRAEAAHS